MKDSPSAPNRSNRLQLLLDSDELARMDDWRYSHRMPSLAAAIRELVRRGLLYQDPAVIGTPDPKAKSTEFRAVPE